MGRASFARPHGTEERENRRGSASAKQNPPGRRDRPEGFVDSQRGSIRSAAQPWGEAWAEGATAGAASTAGAAATHTVWVQGICFITWRGTHL